MRQDFPKRKPVQRLEKMVRRYEAKLGSFFPGAALGYEKGIREFVLFADERVREILHQNGVSVVFHWAYYGFGRQVFKLIQKKREEKIPEIVEDAVKRKGLSREILRQITEALLER